MAITAAAPGTVAPRVIDDAMRNSFLPVCGPYQEERAGEKSQPELKALKELRTWR